MPAKSRVRRVYGGRYPFLFDTISRIQYRQESERFKKLCSRVVRKRRLVAKYRAWTHASIPADVTASTYDRAVDLRGRGYACVSPNHGIRYRRFFVDMDTRSENGVDDLRMRLDHTALADDRISIDASSRRTIDQLSIGLWFHLRDLTA